MNNNARVGTTVVFRLRTRVKQWPTCCEGIRKCRNSGFWFKGGWSSLESCAIYETTLEWIKKKNSPGPIQETPINGQDQSNGPEPNEIKRSSFFFFLQILRYKWILRDRQVTIVIRSSKQKENAVVLKKNVISFDFHLKSLALLLSC